MILGYYQRGNPKLGNPYCVGSSFKKLFLDGKLFLMFAQMYYRSLFICFRRILTS